MRRHLDLRPSGVFGTQSLGGHLLRGAVAFGLLYAAVQGQQQHPLLAMGGGLLALLVLRGCPICWAIGLVETVRQRFTSSAGPHPSKPDL
jgi:hypothetical protein